MRERRSDALYTTNDAKQDKALISDMMYDKAWTATCNVIDT